MDSSGVCLAEERDVPKGVRVLIVDNDCCSLLTIETFLKNCNYEVKTSRVASDALAILEGTKDWFDIVITDLNLPDMDVFEFIKHVRHNMNILVMMMVSLDDWEMVDKKNDNGVCNFLLKPLTTMGDVKKIWLHAYRKYLDNHDEDRFEEFLSKRNQTDDQCDNSSGGNLNVCGTKIKRVDEKNNDRQPYGGESSSKKKKSRLIWTEELHRKFVDVVDQLGGSSKASPKKILKLMKEECLTRERVASHLQKYRLSQSPNEKKVTSTSSGMNLADIGDNSGNNVNLSHNSVTQQQSMQINYPWLPNSQYPFQTTHGGPWLLNSQYPFETIYGGGEGVSSIHCPQFGTPFQTQNTTRLPYVEPQAPLMQMTNENDVYNQMQVVNNDYYSSSFGDDLHPPNQHFDIRSLPYNDYDNVLKDYYCL